MRLNTFLWRIYNVGLGSLRADLAYSDTRSRLFGHCRTFFYTGDITGHMMGDHLSVTYKQ